MPNRYAMNGDGGDWWSMNAPGAEQGGIAGTGNVVNTGPMQTQTAAGPAVGSPGTWQGNQPGATTWQEPGGWTGTSAVGGPEQFGGDYQKWFMALAGNRPWNQQTLTSLEPTLNQYGVQLTPPNASGDRTKIGLPNGQWVRVLNYGQDTPSWFVQPGTGGSEGGASMPVNPNANTAQWGALSGQLGAPAPFQAPTLADLQATPGYQSGLQLGQQAMERSAAAKGSLLSGGFQTALNKYAQNYGQNFYQNAFQNALQGYQQNVNTQSTAPWSRYMDLLNLGYGSAGQLGSIGKTAAIT